MRIAMLLALAGGILAHAAKFTTIDVPGATGTIPACINMAGTIAGNYRDANNSQHGFVRTADGTITSFDAPGCAYTAAVSINNSGVIAGECQDAQYVHLGFVRTPDGAITTFDAPDAMGGQGTQSAAVDAAGTIAGWYVDAHNVSHGFVRTADGAITEFDAPGAGTGSYQGTNVYAINDGGAIVGTTNGNAGIRAFTRSPAGIMKSFEVSGAALTALVSVNQAGVSAGVYTDSNGVSHGLVPDRKARSLHLTCLARPLEEPGRRASTPRGTSPGATPITRMAFADSCAPGGAITTFNAPGAGPAVSGTAPMSINAAGAIAGSYTNSGDVIHGFVLTP